MWVGFSATRVSELWMPPRRPVISLPGTFAVRSSAWYMKAHPADALADDRPGAQRAVAVVGLDPVVVLDSARRASASLIHRIGPPRDSVSMIRFSV